MQLAKKQGHNKIVQMITDHVRAALTDGAAPATIEEEEESDAEALARAERVEAEERAAVAAVAGVAITAAATHKQTVEVAQACIAGEEKKVQKWLKRLDASSDIDTMIKLPTFFFGWTMLMFATGYRRERLVKMLLAHNATVNLQNAMGHSALHLARRAAQNSPRQPTHCVM